MPLSVVIITFNEERNIERCLKSILPIADEIVVVDSFSTDRTMHICKQYNTRFIQRAFDGYGTQKQFATAQASFNYILSLDADEELSEELKDSILKKKDNFDAACYSFNRKNIYCGKAIRYCGWYPDKQIRLYNKTYINWNDKNVHESITVPINEKLIHLKGDLEHYTCSSIAEHQQKEGKYARMNAENLIASKDCISFLTPYLKSGFRFFSTYILLLGILDGYYGFVISKTLAKSSFLKYSVARQQLKLKR
jgi:(heptosyl)LPS beta-1,4-glucosyltransferase